MARQSQLSPASKLVLVLLMSLALWLLLFAAIRHW